jgi:Trk K+ transport system NAD-binding subunit
MHPLLSDAMFSYMPISEELVMAEVHLPADCTGKTVAEAGIRESLGLNVVAVKPAGEGEFVFITPEYTCGDRDQFLVAGSTENVRAISDKAEDLVRRSRRFRHFFRRGD